MTRRVHEGPINRARFAKKPFNEGDRSLRASLVHAYDLLMRGSRMLAAALFLLPACVSGTGHVSKGDAGATGGAGTTGAAGAAGVAGAAGLSGGAGTTGAA